MSRLAPALFAATILVAASLAAPARADEGMWTFDAFPTDRVREAYGWAPDQAWLDAVQSAAVRLTGGCSASVVSPEGLVLTNHHCVVGCVQDLSNDTTDYVTAGFSAATREEEARCPGQQAEIVTEISDVTPRVRQALGTLTGEALIQAETAAISAIEGQSCTDTAHERCEVVKLYGGGQYKLYRYRKYSDVRLVFAPEFQAAFFGGDPDNFNFPRYALDMGFLRLYEDGAPVSADHHLRWNPTPPAEGDLTFVVGNPGSTQRLWTMGQFAQRRDLVFPRLVPLYAELRGRLIRATEESADKEREGRDFLFGLENSYKVYTGQWQALRDPAFYDRLQANEDRLRAALAEDPQAAAAIGDPWQQVSQAGAAYRNFFDRYFLLEYLAGGRSDLYDYARTLVRAAVERAKPEAERLPGYSASNLPLLEHELTDPHPTYDWLDELQMEFWLSKTREILTVDDPAVKAMLGDESPEDIAHRLVSGSSLDDPAVRQRLYDGGLAAIETSDDPLIAFVRDHDPVARDLVRRYQGEVEAPITEAQSKLAEARFAAYGDDLYPDATFTLRISYGEVKGWTYGDATIEPFTHIGGLYDRATGSPPFDLAPKFAAAENEIDKDVVYDFVTTNDIIGGNSGSPVITRDMSVVGAAFDGNIHSIGGSYGYDPELNRTVVVSTAAAQEALGTVYHADGLLAELNGN